LSDITDDHKLAAAYALAEYVTDIHEEKLLPDSLDKDIAYVVAKAVMEV
jgi:malic enzyme